MTGSELTSTYDSWTRPSYEVRVRGTKYLWGSAGLKKDLTFGKPLILHLRNDMFGEPIELATHVASGGRTILGTIDPGECVSIALDGHSGVSATCLRESVVTCIIN